MSVRQMQWTLQYQRFFNNNLDLSLQKVIEFRRSDAHWQRATADGGVNPPGTRAWLARSAQGVASQLHSKKHLHSATTCAKKVTMSRKARHRDSMAVSFQDNINKIARKNLVFRKQLYTGSFSELVVMNIPRMGELGEEADDSADEITQCPAI